MSEEGNNSSESFKEELDKIRADYNRAKRLLENIQAYNNTFVALKSRLEDEENGIDANVERVNILAKRTEGYEKQSKSLLEEISTDLQKVKERIVSMQEAYTQFSEIKGKITSVNGEIDSLVNTSRSLFKDIEIIKNDAQKTLENVKNIFTEVQSKIQNMQTAYDEFARIKGNIEDEESGLEAIFNEVKNLQKKSQLLFTEIQSFRDESSKLLESIKSNREESDVMKKNIDENLNFSKDKKKEIEDITGLLIDATFSETFERRKREIEDRLYSFSSWKTIFFVSTIFLVFLVILPFTPWVTLDNDNLLRYLINRVFYATPLIFLIAFSASQYSKERDLSEKYAFKAASSAAVRSHIEFLIKTFGVKKEDILEFAKDTFIKIYKEPYDVSDNKKLKNLEDKVKALSKNNGKDSDKKLDLEEVIASTKELKELFVDESLLKQVLNFFTNLKK